MFFRAFCSHWWMFTSSVIEVWTSLHFSRSDTEFDGPNLCIRAERGWKLRLLHRLHSLRHQKEHQWRLDSSYELLRHHKNRTAVHFRSCKIRSWKIRLYIFCLQFLALYNSTLKRQIKSERHLIGKHFFLVQNTNFFLKKKTKKVYSFHFFDTISPQQVL